MRSLQKLSAQRQNAPKITPIIMNPKILVAVALISFSVPLAAEQLQEGEPTCIVDKASQERFPPIYPPHLIPRQLAGTTILRVQVSTEGSAAQYADLVGMNILPVHVEKSSRNRDFDRRAIDAASKWHYSCKRSKGHLSSLWARVSVNFTPPPFTSETDPAGAGPATATKNQKMDLNRLLDIAFFPKKIYRDDGALKALDASQMTKHLESLTDWDKVQTIQYSSIYIRLNPEKNILRDTWTVVRTPHAAAPSVYRVRDTVSGDRIYSVLCGSDKAAACELFNYVIDKEIELARTAYTLPVK